MSHTANFARRIAPSVTDPLLVDGHRGARRRQRDRRHKFSLRRAGLVAVAILGSSPAAMAAATLLPDNAPFAAHCGSVTQLRPM